MVDMNSFEEFRFYLNYINRLIELASNLSKESTKIDLDLIRALQAGSLVLMVSTFQNFLQKVIEENIPRLNTEIKKFDLKKFPSKLLLHNYLSSFDLAKIAGNDEIVKIQNIRKCALNICDNLFSWEAFIDKRLPSPENIKEMFKVLDKSEIFIVLRIRYSQKTANHCPETYIQDMFNYIISCRNIAAHNYIDKLNLTINDIKSYYDFLINIAEIIYEEYVDHIDYIIEQSKPLFP